MISKRGMFFICIFLVLIIPFCSAGIGNWFNELTGKATTQPVNLNISVTTGSAPLITIVWNTTMTNLTVSGTTEGPLPTYVMINFTASDAEGYGNLNDSSSAINFSKTSEDTRQNTSCVRVSGSGNVANYTCNVTMWWWDSTGIWDIQAFIKDYSGNTVTNNTADFSIGSTTGFVASPSSLTWTAIAPSAADQLASNNPMLLNNTGNIARTLQVNATDLIGETTPTKALYAENFSVHETNVCGGTGLVENVYTAVADASLPKGNYTLNNGNGQEQLYYCMEAANADLPAQYYSTAARGAWNAKIVA